MIFGHQMTSNTTESKIIHVRYMVIPHTTLCLHFIGNATMSVEARLQFVQKSRQAFACISVLRIFSLTILSLSAK
jgi:hypothetical protein